MKQTRGIRLAEHDYMGVSFVNKDADALLRCAQDSGRGLRRGGGWH